MRLTPIQLDRKGPDPAFNYTAFTTGMDTVPAGEGCCLFAADQKVAVVYCCVNWGRPVLWEQVQGAQAENARRGICGHVGIEF